MDAGVRIHEYLAERYRLLGWICEETQINYLYRDTGTKFRIEDLLMGTPDMFKFEKGVLYVVDHKTTDGALKKTTTAIWNQLSFYALMILNNYCGKIPTYISKIVLECWIYGRKQTIPASADNLILVEKLEIVKFTQLTKNVIKRIQTKLSQPYLVAPFSKGYII